METNSLEPIIEAMLFAYGEKLELNKISEILKIDINSAKFIINKMIQNYNNKNRGITIREIENGYQLCTKPEYYDYIKILYEPKQKQGLSQSAFEVLSIIAYNQPVTKSKIEHIRGVNSDSPVSRLLERNLIKEAGRLDSPGKPIIYETTEEFLRSFGFKSCTDLPIIEINENIID